MQVVEYDPDRAFALHTVEGLPVNGKITIEPNGDGSRFRFRVQCQPTGLARLGQPLLRTMLKRQFEQHCTNRKAVLEAPGEA